ncbi:cell division protein ZapA [Alkalicoccobacillus porphyridii]|uniref:Cell division protein ZapA n=1 Tax=Alkalicoccobacillus porphyridii TaxID=2597270 RepID=A0A554A2W0_9BACI|nr:cell division protein ZapA [Alkalicoccobacillus porphyridii]
MEEAFQVNNRENNKHRTTVSIYGQQYTVVGQEDPAHVKEVARIVNDQMREIKRRNPYLDTTRLAVLTAVNVVSEYKKAEAEQRNKDS